MSNGESDDDDDDEQYLAEHTYISLYIYLGGPKGPAAHSMSINNISNINNMFLFGIIVVCVV
jgi:hypothetical protein